MFLQLWFVVFVSVMAGASLIATYFLFSVALKNLLAAQDIVGEF